MRKHRISGQQKDNGEAPTSYRARRKTFSGNFASNLVTSIFPHLCLSVISNRINGYVNLRAGWTFLLIILFASFIMSIFSGCVNKGNIYGETREGPNYYPLESGSSWEYERISFKDGAQTTDRHSIVITGKQDIGNDMTEFYNQKNEEFLIKSKQGLLLPSGRYILKYPLIPGAEWVSGDKIYDQRLFKVDASGITISIQGKTYHNCIKIVETTNFHQSSEKGGYRAFETTSIYAPNVGPVLYEVYKIMESGERSRVLRGELLSFTTNQSVPSSKPPRLKSPRLITEKESFRFPERCFHHSSLSPDDKWLCYSRMPCASRSVKEWENEILYTRVGNFDEKTVPFSADDEKRNVVGAYNHTQWSPDGKILAVHYRTETDYEWIGLVDFSGNSPRHIESFRSPGPLYWLSERAFLFLSESGMITRKKPGEKPDATLPPGRVQKFMVASDGTILYTDYDQSVYLTSMALPGHRIELYHRPTSKTRSKGSLELSTNYNIAPKGDYAVFYLDKDKPFDKEMGALVDLKRMQIIDRFPIKRWPNNGRWSPDGTKLAYLEDTAVEIDNKNQSRMIKAERHFFILDLESQQRKDYGVNISDCFNWTPDGNHIIYNEWVSHYFDGIKIMRISDGKKIGQLTAKVFPDSKIYVSPSNKYISWDDWDHSTFFVVENPFRDIMKNKERGADKGQ